MLVFLPYMNLYSKTSWELYLQFTKTKLKFQEKWKSYGFNFKNVSSYQLCMHKLSEHYFRQNWLKFYNKMDLSIQMSFE